jgi:hypothetical protein
MRSTSETHGRRHGLAPGRWTAPSMPSKRPSWQSLRAQARGEPPGIRPSMGKVLGSELRQRLTELGVEIAAHYAAANLPLDDGLQGELADSRRGRVLDVGLPQRPRRFDLRRLQRGAAQHRREPACWRAEVHVHEHNNHHRRANKTTPSRCCATALRAISTTTTASSSACMRWRHADDAPPPFWQGLSQRARPAGRRAARSRKAASASACPRTSR